MHNHIKSEKRLFLSFLLNFSFTFFEFFGGLLTGSIALMSDALHDLGDSISMGIAIFLERKSKQKADYKYTYGYHRFSLLGGFISSLILIAGSTIIIYKSVERLMNPTPLSRSGLLIIFAIFGVVINGLAAYNASKGSSINERVITLHLLEDVFGWVALLVTSIVIHFFHVDFLDAVLSLLFSIYIIFHVFRSVKEIFEVFLEKAPNSPKIDEICSKLLTIKGVVNVHHVHYWTLDGSLPILTLHVVIDVQESVKEMNNMQANIQATLKALGIGHSTVQIEYKGFDCEKDDCTELSNTEIHRH